MRLAFIATLLAAALLSPACGGGEDGGEPTGATCPSGSTVTYSNFGETFFGTYCTGCHSSELTGADRHGAPADHNFDSLEGIRAEVEHIELAAAGGPDAVNDEMPPSTADDFPSEAERLQLGEWLACDTPE